MPQFYPGETKTAKATLSNPTQRAFDYTGFLYMGTDLAVRTVVPFSLSAGQEKQVSFQVIMPSVAGIYPVHFGVFSEGKNIALYRAEDITLALPLEIASFHYVYQNTYTWSMPPIIHAGDHTHVGYTIRNTGTADVAGVSVEIEVSWPDWYWYDDEAAEWVKEGNAGSVTLTIPYDQYNNVMAEPFTIPPGDFKVWFRFTSPAVWAPGPSSYTVTARVYIDGKLVAERTIDTDVSF